MIQYSLKTWIWVDTLQCGAVTPTKGECLSNPVSARHPLQKNVSFEVDEETVDTVQTSISEEAESHDEEEHSDNADTEELTFHDDHFQKPAVKRISALKEKRKTMPAGIRPRSERPPGRRRSRPYSDSTLPRTGAKVFAKVTSLLVVKDSLWIGRDTGDIIITNIDKESPYDYRFGEVIAVLSVQSFLCWSHGAIRQLMPVGSDRVVACRDFVSYDAKLRHQLLVWEKWGCKDVNDFEEVHYALDKARKERM